MAKAGRKPIEINLKQVESLAAQGLSNEKIYDYLKISHQTFYRKKRELSELSEALSQGRAKGTAKIANVLFNKAAAGDNACMFFYLERKAGWVRQETVKHEGGGPDGKHEHTREHKDELGPGLRALLASVGIHPGGRPATSPPGDSRA